MLTASAWNNQYRRNQPGNGSRHYYNSRGMSAGRSSTHGNNTYYYDSRGMSAGRSSTHGNNTYYYDSRGMSAGRSSVSGDTTYHYDSRGMSAGRSTTQGDTTYHYDSRGMSAGRSVRSGNTIYHYVINYYEPSETQKFALFFAPYCTTSWLTRAIPRRLLIICTRPKRCIINSLRMILDVTWT